MRRGLFLLCLLLIAAFALTYWVSRPSETINAQSNSNDKELIERDTAVPEDRLDRADAEAKAMMAAIKESVQKEFPNFKIINEYFGTGRSHAIGRRGEVHISMAWSKSKARMMLNIDLMFTEKEAAEWLRRGIDGIAMGDFLPPPVPLGEGAVLVKNVTYNKTVTEVGLHFVRSRAIVGAYYSNYKRSSNENEKELIRFVKTVEPLIKPKGNFDDL